MTITRRHFLQAVGTASLTSALAPAAPFPLPRRKGEPPAFFTPIAPSAEDKLVLPRDVSAQIILRWDDPLGSTAPDGTPEKFGFNNDFVCYFPIDGRIGGTSSTEGLLWVNHEYPNPLFVSGYTPADEKAKKKKTAAQIRKERLCVGGSVVHVKRDAGVWKPVEKSKFTRRFTADYPEMAMTGPASAKLKTAVGTLANCSGGRTPWLTALSCEENYPDYNSQLEEGWRWTDVPGLGIDETRYGWVVEIDPYGELPPVKLTALGRFKHENAAVHTGPTGRVVVYMGDDEVDQHLYKFVSAEPVKKDATRAERRKSLERGTLYAADLAKGQWIPLVYGGVTGTKIRASKVFAEAQKKDPTLRIESQADVLIHARVAARALGATPLDRCEDCEVHPLDKSVYVALTNSAPHGNFHGQILRLVEDEDNPEGDSFRYEVFLAGGPQSGLSCPDNLAFDKAGNLWVVCDISGTRIGKGAYKPFANNGLFVVPTAGPSAGDAFQFASGPNESELTGPWFTEDESTMFLAVQHPGEASETADKPTSRWPNGGTDIPRPSLVAITGFKK